MTNTTKTQAEPGNRLTNRLLTILFMVEKVVIRCNINSRLPMVVNVSLPEQPAPVVNVEVKQPEPAPVNLVVERDWNGNIKGIREE